MLLVAQHDPCCFLDDRRQRLPARTLIGKGVTDLAVEIASVPARLSSFQRVDFSNDFSWLTSFHMTSTGRIQEADTYNSELEPVMPRIAGSFMIDSCTILTISSIDSATSENVQVSSPSCRGCSEPSSRARLARGPVLAATLRYASGVDFA
jgi:hypothetical protein